MKYKLVITSTAQKEISDTLKYYVDRSVTAAKRFLDLLETSYNQLEQAPQHYSFFGDSLIVRSLSLKRFPYAIIFRIKNDEVEIIGLHNSYQSPDKILNRI